MSPVVTVNICGIAPACCTACLVVLLPKLSGTEVVRDSSLDGAACQTELEDVCGTNTKVSLHFLGKQGIALQYALNIQTRTVQNTGSYNTVRVFPITYLWIGLGHFQGIKRKCATK